MRLFMDNADIRSLKLFVLMLKYRHKARLHIGQLVKDTSDKLKQASESDHHVEVGVR